MDGYKKELRLFNIKKINVLATALFAVAFLAGGLINIFAFHAVEKGYLVTGKIWLDVIIAIVTLAVGLFLHELLHGFAAIIVGKNKPKEIKFGCNLKQGVLYCHATKPMKASAYEFVLLLPVIVTGIIPFVVSTIFANAVFIAVFAMLIAGGAGDFVMVFDVLKNCKKDTLVIDHEAAPAYYKLYKEGEEPQDFKELSEEEEKNAIIAMEKLSKTESKASLIVKIFLIAIFLCLLVLMLFFIMKIMKFI